MAAGNAYLEQARRELVAAARELEVSIHTNIQRLAAVQAEIATITQLMEGPDGK